MTSEHVSSSNALAAGIPATPGTSCWLFSRNVDLAAFLGSALFSLVLLAIGIRAGLLTVETPDWTWVTAVLLVDVAHVWSTAFLVYFEPRELTRRPRLYLLVPLLAFLIGMGLYACGEMVFWRTLAYLAVFHFVRQQWGWVALYRARLGERDRAGLWLDKSTIYLATLYPLIYWHAHLPRRFRWFREGDFTGSRWPMFDLPQFFSALEQIVRPLYWIVLSLYLLRSLKNYVLGRPLNPGKDIVVATTALCWHLGIVTFNSDYAFTVTNVVIHGVPYFVLVFWFWRRRQHSKTVEQAAVKMDGRENRGVEVVAVEQGRAKRRIASSLLIFLGTVWLLAYVEELLWHRGVWHERPNLFGENHWELSPFFRAWFAPLLAVPQISHYILDGFIWKRNQNPDLKLLFQKPAASADEVLDRR